MNTNTETFDILSQTELEFEEMFQVVDADHSGTISKQELPGRLGEITLEEFKNALLKYNEEPYNVGLAVLNDFD